ncbi:MAG: metalloregulator ArsR/SmtB family transcription factor [Armatimonadota bacterium]|nr:metalloregulator ArsR/SmtB family transcription factor [Armatimonadota bacterium]
MAVSEQMTAPFVLPALSEDLLLAKFFRALGDPTRLRILEAVMDSEKNVTALVELTGAPQGRVSSHLACLRWCGYVATRQEGRQVFYRVGDRRVGKLLAIAKELVADNCERIQSCTIIDRGRLARRPLRRRRRS